MSLVQCGFSPNAICLARVSIHYMSLVQGISMSIVSTSTAFQYIICRWFNYLDILIEQLEAKVSIHYMSLVQN